MKLFCQIDAGAFASIMIVLVFTVLFSTWLAPTHHGIGADLPKISHPVPMSRAGREDAMLITVMRDGSIYFGVDKVGPYQVRSKILDRLQDRSVERKVYIPERISVCGMAQLKKSSTACVVRESNRLHSWSISVGLLPWVSRRHLSAHLRRSPTRFTHKANMT